MKRIFCRAARTVSLGALLSLVAVRASAVDFVSVGGATTIPPLATLQSDHRVHDVSGKFVLTLQNNPFGRTRFRIGVFASGQTQKLAEARRDFALKNGALSASFHVDAPPGDYDLRILADDDARTPLLVATTITIPGVRRAPSWWLFNGQLFASPYNITFGVASPNAPLFIAGLKRDFSPKAKPISRNILSNTLLQYRVLELPPLSEISAPNYDFAALRLKIIAQMDVARKSGQRNLAGFELPLGVTNRSFIDASAKIDANTKVVVGRLRQILNEVAPDAALILRVDAFVSLLHIQVLQDCAPLCDAVVLEVDARRKVSDLWSLKNLRRIAEEQPNYDLPIFVRQKPQFSGAIYDNALSESSWGSWDLLMSGATGFIEYSNVGSTTWKNVINRNASLFVGSVTLEDIGILAIPEWNFETNVGSSEMFKGNAVLFYQTLRDAGRIPQTSRLPDLSKKESERKTESLMVTFADRISSDTIERLRATAKAGNRVYIEGAPTQDENGKETGWRMGSLVGGDVQKRDIKTTNDPSSMTLQDGWMFGTNRGTRISVNSPFRVTLNKGSVEPRAKDEKGVDVLLKPRVAAVLDDGSPAMIINPVGKGEVIWMPFSLNADAAQRRQFYQAVSNYVEPSLVTLRATNASTDVGNVHVALRRSAKGALLLGLFNDDEKPSSVEATLESAAGVALDLQTERELPFTTRGNETTIETSIPAHGWRLLAFAIDRKTLDAERNAFAGKVKLK